MIILSHRGYWKSMDEKNSDQAFRRSFSLGYGTETDIRDCRGELVISHDMPTGNEIRCEDFLSLAAKARTPDGHALTLALNIKADGLAPTVKKLLNQHLPVDGFVFDMAVPDMRSYLEVGVPVFTRMSEVERQPVWLEEASGVWLDAFYGEWYDRDVLEHLLEKGKRVCIVSPELHMRPHGRLWKSLLPFSTERRIMLCTDLPEEASHFFQI